MTSAHGTEMVVTGRPRRPRGSLSAGRIVDESLRLLDECGLGGFSLPKLGRALASDPTAIYRHFSRKDDLVLAIADRLIDEAMTELQPSECWVGTLIDVAYRLRRTYRAHPAAASLVTFRTTRRPAEMRAVDVLIGAMLRAGFAGSEAGLMYRAFADFVLSFAGGEASFAALDAKDQAEDRAAWSGAYLTVDRLEYPHTWRIRDVLPGIVDDAVFDTVLGLVIAGIGQRAPVACECGRHDPASPTIAAWVRRKRSPSGGRRPPRG